MITDQWQVIVKVSCGGGCAFCLHIASGSGQPDRLGLQSGIPAWSPTWRLTGSAYIIQSGSANEVPRPERPPASGWVVMPACSTTVASVPASVAALCNRSALWVDVQKKNVSHACWSHHTRCASQSTYVQYCTSVLCSDQSWQLSCHDQHGCGCSPHWPTALSLTCNLLLNTLAL